MRPADGLVDPVFLTALVVLVVNDQLGKTTWPGPVTGLASDIAGLIVAPLAVQAAWEIGEWAIGRWRGPSLRVLGVAIGVVAVAFAAIQLWPPATDAYRVGLGVLQWPLRAAIAVATCSPVPEVARVRATADVWDLLALPALLVTWWAGRRRAARAAVAPMTVGVPR